MGVGLWSIFFRFLITPDEYLVEVPEWFGVSTGIGYRINESKYILLKQSVGGGLFGFLGDVVLWGVSHTSISPFPCFPWPLEIFLEYYSLFVHHPERNGDDEWSSWDNFIKGGIRLSLGWHMELEEEEP